MSTTLLWRPLYNLKIFVFSNIEYQTGKNVKQWGKTWSKSYLLKVPITFKIVVTAKGDFFNFNFISLSKSIKCLWKTSLVFWCRFIFSLVFIPIASGHIWLVTTETKRNSRPCETINIILWIALKVINYLGSPKTALYFSSGRLLLSFMLVNCRPPSLTTNLSRNVHLNPE